MKVSCGIFIFSLLIFWACDHKPKKLMVRPLEESSANSIYNTVLAFDRYPSLGFGKKINHTPPKTIPDTLFTHRIRIKNVTVPFDAKENFPAFPLDVILPDSVKLGDAFYYLVVLRARKNAMFSRMHLEKKSDNLFIVRAYQQIDKEIPAPSSQYEEILRSFYPQKKGIIRFQYYFYDTYQLERKVIVY